jgi:adenylate cyclase
MGERIRITAQLISASTGIQLWAERYDRSIHDLFTVQDEVVQTLAATLEGRLAATIAEQATRKPTLSMAAYECVLKARELIATYKNAAAETLLRRATELDPDYAQAYAWLGVVQFLKFFFDSRQELLDEALVYAKKAVALDESDAMCHCQLGQTYVFRRQFDLAAVHSERALSLNPNDAVIITLRGHFLSRVGRQSEALHYLDLALQCDPFPPSWYWETRAIPLMAARRYQEAIDAITKMTELYSWNYAYLAAGFAHLGQLGRARTEAAEVLRLQPGVYDLRTVVARTLQRSGRSQPDC